MTISHLRHHTSYGTPTRSLSVGKTLKWGALRTLTVLGTALVCASNMLPLAQASSPAPAPDEQPHASLKTTLIFWGMFGVGIAGLCSLNHYLGKVRNNDDKKDDIDIEAQTKLKEKIRADYRKKYNPTHQELSRKKLINNVFQKMGMTLGGLGGLSALSGMILGGISGWANKDVLPKSYIQMALYSGVGAVTLGTLLYLYGTENEKDPLLFSIKKDLENPDFKEKCEKFRQLLEVIKSPVDEINEEENIIQGERIQRLRLELLEITSEGTRHEIEGDKNILNTYNMYLSEFNNNLLKYNKYKKYTKNSKNLSPSEQALLKQKKEKLSQELIKSFTALMGFINNPEGLINIEREVKIENPQNNSEKVRTKMVGEIEEISDEEGVRRGSR